MSCERQAALLVEQDGAGLLGPGEKVVSEVKM